MKPARRPPPWMQSEVHGAVVVALVEARRLAGLTQRQVSDAIRRPPSFVAKVESGERNLSVTEAMRIAQVLGTSLAEVLAPVEADLPSEFEI